MAKKPNRKLSQSPTWDMGSIRLTAFLTQASQVDEQSWWHTLTGNKPETINDQPRIDTRIEDGPFGPHSNGRLVFSHQPLRIDWYYGISNQIIELARDLNDIALGQYSQEITPFSELMKKWFSLSGRLEIVRLAFGTVLLQPVQSVQQGYELLSQYLPFDIPSGNARDFLYQINRPRDFNAGNESFQLNRLSKWSVLRIKHQLRLLESSEPLRESPEIFAASLELDLSTPAEFRGILDRSGLPNLWDTLVRLGTEIAEKGDIP